uniref:Uncharacterized protein n=1 Tax=Globisporangium ultimum (strain ATCC 200006 / CBS 805.95 / DAOM BR144) TaxID=431595 RepID=K3W9I6_GLOUD
MADEEQFLDEIAPFLDAVVHESLPEPWCIAAEQSEPSATVVGCAPFADLANGMVSDTLSTTSLADPKVCVTPEDITNYDMLFEEIDPAYMLLDRIHEENGLSFWVFDASAPSTSYAQIKTRRSSLGDEAQFIELINSDVVSHDFELTYQLSWYAWELMYFAKNCVAYDDKPASVIAYKWRAEMPLDGELVMFEYLNATKWYREDNRICCVWRSISTVESHFPGMFVDETGWQVLKPVVLFEHEHNGIPACNGTAMLTSTHMECKRFGDTTSVSFDEVQARQLVNIAASAFQEDLRKVHAMIVNMFVHDPRVAAPEMADDAHFLAEIAPFLEAAQESVDELWDLTTGNFPREDELLLLAVDAVSVPATRAKRSRNSTRDNMKRELQALRAQSAELHQQLAALRHARDERRKSSPLPSPQQTLLLVSTWERIAKRRLLERTRAEKENQRLKAQVDNNSTIAANLQRSVQQFMASFAAGDPNATSTFRAHASMDSRGTRLTDTDVMPYDMDLAFSLSWHCWEQRGVAKNGVLHDHVLPRVSAYKGRIDVPFNGETIGLDYLNVTKWYREEGRNNCVWRGRTKVDSHFPGVYMDEYGWQIIKPLPSSGEGDKMTATGSVILACSQFECKRVGGAPVSLKEDEASQLAKLAVSMYENDVLEVNNMMMNMMNIVTEVALVSPLHPHNVKGATMATTRHFDNCGREHDDNGFAVDVAQLLDETDELLCSLGPFSFATFDSSDLFEAGPLGANSKESGDAPQKPDSVNEMMSIVAVNPTQKKRGRRSKPGAKPNHSRERMQRELVTLRSQVVWLEKDLLRLRGAKNPIRHLTTPKVWEEMAKSQATKREKAEADNKRLKVMVATHKTLMTEMENRILNWQHATTSLIHSPSLAMIQSKNVHLDPGDEVLLEIFISELDATYARLMSNVAWYCMGQPNRSSDVVHYKSIAGDEDVIAFKQRVKRVYNGVDVYCHVWYTIKRVTLSEQSIIVWRGMYKGEECFEGSTKSLE